MFFWILDVILVELGCQERPESDKKCMKIYVNLNTILIDFGWPGAAFEAACPQDPTQGTGDLGSRAKA